MTAEQRRWVLSGGLASGKSMVRATLEGFGVLTIDADRVGHTALLSDGPAFSQVVERWPNVIREGEIHRPSLASIVFNDPDELRALEGITHPHIFDTILARVEGVESTVVVEVPLLSHGLGDDWRRIVVDCRDDVRLRRAVERGMDERDAISRMAAQPGRAEWLAAADLGVPNHGSPSDLEKTVSALVSALDN